MPNSERLTSIDEEEALICRVDEVSIPSSLFAGVKSNFVSRPKNYNTFVQIKEIATSVPERPLHFGRNGSSSPNY